MPQDIGVRPKLLQVVSLSVLIVLIIGLAFLVNGNNDATRQISWQNDGPAGEIPDDPSEPALSAPPDTSADGPPVPIVVGTTKKGLVEVKFPPLDQIVKINPKANILNRPQIVVPKDDYLGPRPNVDTEVDTQRILNVCRGSHDRLEYMRNTSKCIDYLANEQEEYTFVPELAKRASQQDPRRSEYVNADGHQNTQSRYVSLTEAKPAIETSRGTCPGPIIPYHVYWRGAASWRVELFIKGYLYTQNLPCSQLNIWLDSDPFPNAVHDMLNCDPLIRRFLPLVERGDIVVRAWNFPNRIPIPYLDEDSPGEDVLKKLVVNKALGKETKIGPNMVQDASGQRWIILSSKQMTFLPVAVSDAMRFIVLHLHGGVYFDMDIVMLRDMRPLVLPSNHSFAERWAMNADGGYNTAILSMTANSSLSTYFLRGAVSMGVNFHPLVLGIMAKKDGRNLELMTMEHGLFDPLWTDYSGTYDGKPIVPDHAGDYARIFSGKPNGNKGEWAGYQGPQLPMMDINTTMPTIEELKPAVNVEHYHFHGAHNALRRKEIIGALDMTTTNTLINNLTATNTYISADDLHLSHFRASNQQPTGYKDSFELSSSEIRHLLNLSIISSYDITVDKYPPNNRTLQNFYRGAFTYHIHNQWSSHPEPNSWLNVMQTAHDRFFQSTSTNAYGEMWKGPRIMRYNLWPEYF